MDNLKKNIRVILETNFTGFKDEIIDAALKSIMILIMDTSEVRKNGYDSGYEDASNDLLKDILPLFGLDISQFKKDGE